MMAAAPALWLLLFAAFILRARLALGRWPLPYSPDPKALGYDAHYYAVVGGIPVLFAVAITLIALAPMLARRPNERWMLPIAAVTGVAGVILLAQVDPGGLFTWLGD